MAGIAIGTVPIPLKDLFSIIVSSLWRMLPETWQASMLRLGLFQKLAALMEEIPETWQAIVLRLRLPRVLAAMLVGSALGLSGSTMQGLFKNPLADPFIIGVSSGASVGAAAAMLLGLAWTKAGAFAIPLAAFAGGMGSLLLVYSLSGSGGRRSTLSL
ncbi:MAG TPA: hypothetical protein DDY38_11075, partial [Firmicutes bacterium]|nr:hypothetical protein [Bacillota bacterium]